MTVIDGAAMSKPSLPDLAHRLPERRMWPIASKTLPGRILLLDYHTYPPFFPPDGRRSLASPPGEFGAERKGSSHKGSTYTPGADALFSERRAKDSRHFLETSAGRTTRVRVAFPPTGSTRRTPDSRSSSTEPSCVVSPEAERVAISTRIPSANQIAGT